MDWKSVGKGMGYVGFFFLSVFMFLWLTFPEERLKSFVTYRLELATGYPTELLAFEMNGLSGMELTGLAFRLPRVDPLPEPPPEIIPQWQPADPGAIEVYRKQRQDWVEASTIGKGIIRIDTLQVTTDLIDLAFGKPVETRFNGQVLGGQLVDGLVAPSEKGIQVSISKLQGIKLGEALDVRRWMPYRFSLLGTLSGGMHLDLTPIQGPNGTQHQMEGTINLTVSDAIFEEPSIVVPPQVVSQTGMAIMRLTDIDAGDIELELVMGRKSDIDIKDVKFVPAKKSAMLIYFKKMEMDGDDLKLKFSNRSAIIIDDPTAPLSEARLNLEMVFRLEDDFLSRTVDRDGVKDETPNTPLKLMLDPKTSFSKNDPFKAKLKRAVGSNGDIGFKCTGTLGKPNCEPSRVTSTRIAGSNRRAPIRRTRTERKEKERVKEKEKPRSSMVDTSGRRTNERRGADSVRSGKERRSSVRDTGEVDRNAAQKRKIEEARRRRDELKRNRGRAAGNRELTRTGRVVESDDFEEDEFLDDEEESEEESFEEDEGVDEESDDEESDDDESDDEESEEFDDEEE